MDYDPPSPTYQVQGGNDFSSDDNDNNSPPPDDTDYNFPPIPPGMEMGAYSRYDGQQEIDRWSHFEIAFTKAVLDNPKFKNCRSRIDDETFRGGGRHLLMTDYDWTRTRPK